MREKAWLDVNRHDSDELDKRLRIEIAKRMGGRKGDLTKAVIEAIDLWLQ